MKGNFKKDKRVKNPSYLSHPEEHRVFRMYTENMSDKILSLLIETKRELDTLKEVPEEIPKEVESKTVLENYFKDIKRKIELQYLLYNLSTLLVT